MTIELSLRVYFPLGEAQPNQVQQQGGGLPQQPQQQSPAVAMAAHMPFSLSCQQDAASCLAPDECARQKRLMEHYIRCPVGQNRQSILKKDAEKCNFRPMSVERQQLQQEIMVLDEQAQRVRCDDCNAYLRLVKLHAARCPTTRAATFRQCGDHQEFLPFRPGGRQQCPVPSCETWLRFSVVARARQRLMREINHAKGCNHQSNPSSPTPCPEFGLKCNEAKDTFAHMRSCEVAKLGTSAIHVPCSAQRPDCDTFRQLMYHAKKCKNPTCYACGRSAPQ